MQDEVLVSATVITDDSTGCYEVGELDFQVPHTTIEWLEKEPERRELLARHLEWLAVRCRSNKSPFNI